MRILTHFRPICYTNRYKGEFWLRWITSTGTAVAEASPQAAFSQAFQKNTNDQGGMSMDWLDWLLENIQGITWQMAVMWVIGGVLIYLAIKKEMEPTLLLPMGLGAILVNLPMDGALKELQILYDAGIATELFPLLLFIGIGAMIDFGPLLSNPKMILCGAAAAVRHLLYAVAGAPAGLYPAGRGLHRHHRRGGRPDLHLRGAAL